MEKSMAKVSFEAHIVHSEETIEIPKGAILFKQGENFSTYCSIYNYNGELIEFSTYDQEDYLKSID